MRAHTAWLLLLVSNAACLRQTEFHCMIDTDCSGGGTCQGGFCAFADGTCSSGQRFGDSAGPHAGQCVGASSGEAGVDATADAPVDMVPAGCPNGYMNAGSEPHMYKIITMATDWATQRDACAATKPGGAYLAIPDKDTELAAIDALLGGTGTYWIGVDDMATPGVYVNVKGASQTFLPWAGGQPDMGPPPKLCVKSDASNNQWSTDKCNNPFPAVCECEP